VNPGSITRIPRQDREELVAFVRETYDVCRFVIFQTPEWLPDEHQSYQSAFMALEGSIGKTFEELLPEKADADTRDISLLAFCLVVERERALERCARIIQQADATHPCGS
jgi:hypothetical protein